MHFCCLKVSYHVLYFYIVLFSKLLYTNVVVENFEANTKKLKELDFDPGTREVNYKQ